MKYFAPKVFALSPHENWICDRFVNEWNTMSHQSTKDPYQSNVIWLLSDWCWQNLPIDLLKRSRVVTTVHHIVPEKMSAVALSDFAKRDALTTVYHVPCEATRRQVEQLTSKPIKVIPFWVNKKMWSNDGTKSAVLRQRYALPADAYLIGSFQRDTEGSDLKSPKLEKGPDRLCDAIETLAQQKNVCVVLSGWRRQYVEGRLLAAGIQYRKFELVPDAVLKDLYCALDLYLVTARYEGGPQAIVECAALGVPVVSTPAGLAPEILAPESVGEDVTLLTPNTEYAKNRVSPYLTPNGMSLFCDFFESIV